MDLKHLGGKWELESLSTEAEAVPKKLFKGTTLTVKGDRYILRRPDEKKPIEWALELDTTKKPRQVNLTPPDKTSPTRVGIYELNGDRLKVAMCGVKRKAGRPKSFKPDLGVNVATFKRVKGKK
jgi:uncharacterized protein (TIGR03067 family)